VVVPVAEADHRPERMQHWEPARNSHAVAGVVTSELAKSSAAAAGSPSPPGKRGNPRRLPCDAIYPPWLLPHPLRLQVHGEKPQYHGPLRLLAGPQRLETGWWDAGAQGPAVRDYFIARSEEAGLLWVYRERLAARRDAQAETAPARWFLQGIYA
jgi:protein ImuB